MTTSLRIAAVLLALLFGAGAASAATLTFSDYASIQPPDCGTAGHDPCITAGMLDATLQIDVAGTTLTLTLTNDTSSPTFDINVLYWSASSSVTGLTYLSAVHSAEGNVTGSWTFNTSTGAGGPTHGDGFGVHDFSLTDGVGMSAAMVGPGESIVFSFTILGAGPFSDVDFVQLSADPPSSTNIMTYAAAKFVNADPGTWVYGDNDSSFGGVVPEPATGSLLALGLVALAVRRRSASPR